MPEHKPAYKQSLMRRHRSEPPGLAKVLPPLGLAAIAKKTREEKKGGVKVFTGGRLKIAELERKSKERDAAQELERKKAERLRIQERRKKQGIVGY